MKYINDRNKRQFEMCIVVNEKSSQRSLVVATHLRCGGLFNNQFTTNLSFNLLVKEFNWRINGKE